MSIFDRLRPSGPKVAAELALAAVVAAARAFRAEGTVPDHLAPLCRDGVVRLCCKPPADPRGVE